MERDSTPALICLLFAARVIGLLFFAAAAVINEKKDERQKIYTGADHYVEECRAVLPLPRQTQAGNISIVTSETTRCKQFCPQKDPRRWAGAGREKKYGTCATKTGGERSKKKCSLHVDVWGRGELGTTHANNMNSIGDRVSCRASS